MQISLVWPLWNPVWFSCRGKSYPVIVWAKPQIISPHICPTPPWTIIIKPRDIVRVVIVNVRIFRKRLHWLVRSLLLSILYWILGRACQRQMMVVYQLHRKSYGVDSPPGPTSSPKKKTYFVLNFAQLKSV